MTLSPKLGVVGISTLWHFRLPLPIQMFIKVASSPRLSGIGMPSPILWSHPLKMQRIVLLSSLLWWELGTNSLSQVLVSDCRFGVSPVNYPDPDPDPDIGQRFLFWGVGVGLMARQDYFTHAEPSQSVGGAKTGESWEKPPDHPQAEVGLSHMWPELGFNPQWWNYEPFRALKISGLNHSATMATIGQRMWMQKQCLLMQMHAKMGSLLSSRNLSKRNFVCTIKIWKKQRIGTPYIFVVIILKFEHYGYIIWRCIQTLHTDK